MLKQSALSLGIASALLWPLAGCTPQTPPQKPAAKDGGHDHGHSHGHAHGDHAHEGPHKGMLIELGEEEYHAELVHKEEEELATIYILDDKAQGHIPIEAKELVVNLTVEGKTLQATLAAKPLDGETEGKSSRFEGKLESETNLAMTTLDGAKITGRVAIPIAGKEYVGKIEPHSHDHGHSHQ